MSSVANSFKKAAIESLEYLEDKAAALKAAGKHAEAAEVEKQAARIQKKASEEMGNLSLDDVSEAGVSGLPAPIEGRSAIDSSPIITPPPGYEGFTGPDGVKSFRKVAPPDEGQAKQISSSFDIPITRPPTGVSGLPTVIEGRQLPDASSLNTSLMGFLKGEEGLGGKLMATEHSPGVSPSRSFSKGQIGAAGAAGAGALGLGIASPIGEEETKKKEASPVAPATAEASPVATAEASPKMAYKNDGITASTMSAASFRNYLTDFFKEASAPNVPDVSNLSTSLGELKGRREASSKQLTQDMAAAQATANQANSSLEKRELVEKLTNALGLIVSGMYGEKTGLDMSGVKFDKTDWAKRLDGVRDDLRLTTTNLMAKQQLDAASIEQERADLLANRDTLFNEWTSQYKQWEGRKDLAKDQTSAELSGASFRQEANKANATFEQDVAKFNNELKIKTQEALARGMKPEEAGQKVRESKEQRLSKLKNDLRETAEKLVAGKTDTDMWGSSAEQKAYLGSLAALSSEIEKLQGFPAFGSPDNPMQSIDFQKLPPAKIGAALSASANAEAGINAKLLGLRGTPWAGQGDFLINRKKYMDLATKKALATNPSLSPDAADEMAATDYSNRLKQLLQAAGGQ